MKDTVTVRVQKVKKSGIKTHLIFFLILVAILLLVTLFANQIAPYDPYAQDLSRSMLPPSPTQLIALAEETAGLLFGIPAAGKGRVVAVFQKLRLGIGDRLARQHA